MARLTDEELSRVLTAHAVGELVRGGIAEGLAYPCCLIQAARACGRVLKDPEQRDLSVDACWFDLRYYRSWTVDEFLAQLVARGLA